MWLLSLIISFTLDFAALDFFIAFSIKKFQIHSFLIINKFSGFSFEIEKNRISFEFKEADERNIFKNI